MKYCLKKQHFSKYLKLLLLLSILTIIASANMLLYNAHAGPFASSEQSVSNHLKSLNVLPPGSTPAIAQTLLKDLPSEYQLQKNGKGFSLSNPSHGIEIAFNPGGLQIKSAGKSWGMTMSGIGSTGSIKPVQKAILVNDGGRMVYERGNISEWYVNSQWGVEQGFTILEPPQRKDRDNLVVELELSLSGNLLPILNSDTLLLADAQGNSIARYTGLQVFDANSTILPAHLTLTDNKLRIHVDDTDAQYPVVIDPWIQQAKFTADDGVTLDDFGWSVAISGDTIVIGAPHDDDRGNSSGSAYVFVRPESGWFDMTQTAKLTASDGTASDNFGNAVAIDGDTIIIGVSDDDDNGIQSGSVYIFTKPLNGWTNMTQTAKLTASDGGYSHYLGHSVAINGDTIVAGAIGIGTVSSSSAYVFEKPQGGWVNMTQTAKLTASNGNANDWFGYSVAINNDTIAVGAIYDDDNGYGSGSAYVFTKPLNGWTNMTQTAKLTASDGAASNLFGFSVVITSNIIIIGSDYDHDNGFVSGSVYIFTKPESGWVDMVQTAKLKSSDGTIGDGFGRSIAISGDTIFIGAWGDDYNGSNSGSVYIFVKPENVWANMTQTSKFTPSDGAADDRFGNSVAFSGETLIIGAYGDDDNGRNSGSAYVYTYDNYKFSWPMFLPASIKNSQH